jgi:hypothetical protein
MSVAYIVTDAPVFGSASVPRYRVPLGQVTRDSGGILLDFQPYTSATNPSTFTLGAGTYRVDASFSAYQTNSGTTFPSTLNRPTPVALYNETSSTVVGVFNPEYLTESYTTFDHPTTIPTLFQVSAWFQVGQGIRVFSVQQMFGAQGLCFYTLIPHLVTATLGGAVLPARGLQMKILKTG